jgi:peptidoglycan/LPS O-acetylase OafA/YrhL
MPRSPISIPSLHGLRGIFALMVVYHHGWNTGWIPLNAIGHIGVIGFFTLSSFLITYHYMPGTFSWRYWAAYLIRRFFRIYPVLIAVVILFWLASSNWVAVHPIRFSAHNIWRTLLLSNRSWGFWAISPEIYFYLWFPIFACALLLLPIRNSLKTLLIGLLWFYCLINTGYVHHRILSLKPFLVFFAGGIFGGLLYKELEHSPFLSQREWNTIALGSLAILCLCMWPSFRSLAFSHVGIWGNFRTYSLLLVTVIVSCARSNGFSTVALTNPIMQFFGNISYDLYLIHLMVYFLVKRNVALSTPIKFVYALVISILLSWLLHKVVEKPGMRLGKKLSQFIKS